MSDDGTGAVAVKGLVPEMKDLTEADFKRQQLLGDLRRLKDNILYSIIKLKEMVLDIEATKRD